jgi:hypothetical protein
MGTVPISGRGTPGRAGRHVVGAQHVAADRERAPALLSDRARGLGRAGLRDIREDDIGTLARERERCGAPDTARGAGHEGDLPCETPLVRFHDLASA